MAFPPETPFTPEALLRRFVKVFYALGLEHASYAEQQKFKTWFNMVWTSLFKYIRGIRPVAWYDARWWRISEGDREKMFNLVCSWEPEARTGELTLDNLVRPNPSHYHGMRTSQKRPVSLGAAIHHRGNPRTQGTQRQRGCPLASLQR